MKAPEPMKNLWTVSKSGAAAETTHKLALLYSRFAPISNKGQPIDRLTHSGVIPLRSVSY
jgi:hypothetical protein